MAKRDAELEAAQTALLAHDATGTVVRRLQWTHGETQAFELGEDPPLLLVQER